MRLHLERAAFGRDSTAGVLYVPGTGEVYTLEDQYNEPKVHGETCIPEGVYPVELRTVGGFHARYSDRFPDMHRGMLWIREVPGFEYILVHCGNTDDDTAGCILVGETVRMPQPLEWSVGRSTDAYERVYPLIRDAIEAGEDVTLKVARRWEQVA